jgi:hypothetical protein
VVSLVYPVLVRIQYGKVRALNVVFFKELECVSHQEVLDELLLVLPDSGSDLMLEPPRRTRHDVVAIKGKLYAQLPRAEQDLRAIHQKTSASSASGVTVSPSLCMSVTPVTARPSAVRRTSLALDRG